MGSPAEIQNTLPNTFLVVDDCGSLNNIMAECLETLGYQVHRATSGAEALNILFSVESPWLGIITDYKMPGMNGGVLLKAVADRRIPVHFAILVTGLHRGNPRVLKIRKSVGTRFEIACLPKPFDFPKLEQVIVELKQKIALANPPSGSPRK